MLKYGTLFLIVLCVLITWDDMGKALKLFASSFPNVHTCQR
jgi:hypothetical protein